MISRVMHLHRELSRLNQRVKKGERLALRGTFGGERLSSESWLYAFHTHPGDRVSPARVDLQYLVPGVYSDSAGPYTAHIPGSDWNGCACEDIGGLVRLHGPGTELLIGDPLL